MPGHSFEDEAAVEDTFEEFERNRDIPGKIESYKIQAQIQNSIPVILRSVPILQPLWLHRCWWRMLETKRVNDNYKMVVTVLAILVTDIHYIFTLASVTNIQKMSPTMKFCHQNLQIVINFKSPTSLSPKCLGIFKSQSSCRILKFWKVAVTLVWTGNFGPLFSRDPLSFS